MDRFYQANMHFRVVKNSLVSHAGHFTLKSSSRFLQRLFNLLHLSTLSDKFREEGLERLELHGAQLLQVVID